MPALTIRLFGALEVQANSELLSGIETNKSRALLAYLAHEHDRLHSREALAALFWPEAPSPRAHQSLSQALYNLRHALCLKLTWNPLIITSQEVRFQLDERTWLDTFEFNRLYEECLTHPHGDIMRCPVCLKNLDRFHVLSRGEFLAGLYLDDCPEFEGWLDDMRQHYNLRMVRVWDWLAADAEQQRDYIAAIEALRTLMKFDPYNETALRRLMQLLARHVGRNEAIGVYRDFQDLLFRDMQLQPESESIQLYESIRDQKDRASVLPPNNLPLHLPELIGREVELSELYRRLVDPQNRLITLLGPGGAGKTHLALEAARAMLLAFPDGVYLLEMSGLTNPDALLPAIARVTAAPTLGEGEIYRTPRTPYDVFIQNLYQHLKSKDLLLVLDSFETLLSSATALADLLRHAPRLHVLVTSRVRLNLKEEQVIELGGLEVCSSSAQAVPSPAARLFFSVAQRNQPRFSLDDQNLPVIERICQAVEGMPLGILLAAAWTSLIEPVEIEQRIKADLDFLSIGWYDLPEHQRSLRATFEYSWSFLTAQQRQALSRLAIFRQSFTADRALNLFQVDLSMLKELSDHSLLQTSGQGRYRLHDLIHSFCLQKLQEDPAGWHALNEKFCQYYLSAMHAWGEALKTPRFPETIIEIDLEIENVHQAWDWAVRRRNWDGLLVAIRELNRYHRIRNRFSDILSATRAVITAITAEGRNLDNFRLWFWASLYDLLASQELAVPERIAGLEQLEHELEATTWAKLDLRFERAALAHNQGVTLIEYDAMAAEHLLLRSLELYRQVGSRWNIASVLFSLGNCYEILGKRDLERTVLEEALTLNGPQDDPDLLVSIYHFLSLIYLFAGQFEQGIEYFRLKSQLFSNYSAYGFGLSVTPEIGTQLMWAGAFREAYDIYARHREYMQSQNLPISPVLRVANVFLELSLGLYEEAQKSLENSLPDDLKPHMALFRCALQITRGEFSQACQTGSKAYAEIVSIPDHRVSALAACLVSMAFYRLGQPQLSRCYLLEALPIIEETHNILGQVFSLNYLALLLAESGFAEASLSVQASIADHPQTKNSVWLADLFGKPIAALTTELNEGIRLDAQNRGRHFQPLAVVTQLKECLQAENEFLAGIERFANAILA